MRSLKNQRGQGTVEYVLILVLAVTLIMGAIYQLNSAFRVWADNYFGEYLSCLLETGELPSLGDDATGICAQSFKPFSLADGVSPIENAGGGGGGGADPNDAVAGAGEAGTAGTDAGQTATAMQGPSGGRGGARYRVASRGGASGSGEEEDERSKADQSGASTFAEGYQAGRVVRIPIRDSEAIRRGRARRDVKDTTKTKVKAESVSGEERPGAPRLIKISARTPDMIVEDEGFDLSFGNLLRFLIIAIIIIAIVIFIGGQALQVSKSAD